MKLLYLPALEGRRVTCKVTYVHLKHLTKTLSSTNVQAGYADIAFFFFLFIYFYSLPQDTTKK